MGLGVGFNYYGLSNDYKIKKTKDKDDGVTESMKILITTNSSMGCLLRKQECEKHEYK